MRWFEFDTNKSVTFRAFQSGQAGVSGGGFSQFQTALNAWNNEPQTPIRYSYGGTTSASAGFSSFDGVNAILFGDLNQDIEGTYDCSGGGVLAIGGPWF